MCDDCNQTNGSDSIESGFAGNAQVQLKQAAEPSLRSDLERRRTRLTRQLAQVDAALQVLYTVPDAERIAQILKQANS
jgi:hypothetical protein